MRRIRSRHGRVIIISIILIMPIVLTIDLLVAVYLEIQIRRSIRYKVYFLKKISK